MSTRSCIARPVGDEWEGRYHHSDGYPTGLGAELWSKVKQHGVERARAFLIDEHTGWSCILGADWALPSGYVERQSLADLDAVRGPRCYCHGDRAEKGWMIRSRDEKRTNEALSIEWVYVLGNHALTVYSARRVRGTHRTRGTRPDGSKYSFASPRYGWAYVDSYPWSGPEPDWATIEAKDSQASEVARTIAEAKS